jgi:hypothetical protein
VDEILDKLERVRRKTVQDFIDEFEEIRTITTAIPDRILDEIFTQQLPRNIVNKLQTIIRWRRKKFDEIKTICLEIDHNFRSVKETTQYTTYDIVDKDPNGMSAHQHRQKADREQEYCRQIQDLKQELQEKTDWQKKWISGSEGSSRGSGGRNTAQYGICWNLLELLGETKSYSEKLPPSTQKLDPTRSVTKRETNSCPRELY